MEEKVKSKLQELETVHAENEMTILSLHRQLYNLRKQAADKEDELRRAEDHQVGVRREIGDFKETLER